MVENLNKQKNNAFGSKIIYGLNSICNKIHKEESIPCKETIRPLKQNELYGLLKISVILDTFTITDKGWNLIEANICEIDKTNDYIRIPEMSVLGAHKGIQQQTGLETMTFVFKATASFKNGYTPIGPIKASEDHIYWMVLPEHIIEKNEIQITSWEW